MKRLIITSENFLTFTNPDEMVSAATRSAVTRHTAKFKRGRKVKSTDYQPRKILEKFWTWRIGTTLNSKQAANEFEQLRTSITPSLDAMPSLQQCEQPINALCLANTLSLNWKSILLLSRSNYVGCREPLCNRFLS